MEIKHLSKTQITMYQRCPYQYFCRYVEGLKVPPSSPLLIGSAFDTAINLEYETKIKNGKGEKVSTLQDCFAEYFDREKGNTIFEEDEKPEELKDTAIKTVKTFHDEICVKVEPVEVQKKDTVKFDNVDYELMVVVDVVDKDGMVIDNKTASKSWPAGKEFQELDPVIYSLWYEANKKKEEKGFRFDIGVMTKTPKTQQLSRKVTAEEKTGFLKFVAYVHDSINRDKERGMFLPRTDHFLCSRKKCGYYQKCEAEWGLRIKD